ncbi:MAG: hypothetical protein J1E05_00535 [Eubacterium sp.]|nr:hypothetical protein [Eubacterium sp.]
MKSDILKDIQGQQIEILEFILNRVDYQLELSLKISCNNEIHLLVFYNVSNINIEALSMPLQIEGFEILSNKNLGYDKSMNYKINDFEENKLSFYCEDFDVFNLDGDT